MADFKIADPLLRRMVYALGVMAALAGFIPYLGAIIGVTPAILIVLLTGDATGSTKFFVLLAVVGLFAAIQTVEGLVLQPKIGGKGVGLHPAIVLLALVAGGPVRPRRDDCCRTAGHRRSHSAARILRCVTASRRASPIKSRIRFLIGTAGIQDFFAKNT
jgi:hypothetical protein